jgi:hypothetical protein
MAKITQITPCHHLADTRKVALSCGHTHVRTFDVPTLRVGIDLVCPSRVSGFERQIVQITASGHYPKATLRLACSHTRELVYSGPITYQTVDDLINTMTPCQKCRAKKS